MAINAERDIKAGQRDITVRQILERMKGKVTEKVIMGYPEGFNRTSPSDRIRKRCHSSLHSGELTAY